MKEVHRAKMNEEGRLLIPAELRKALGLRGGEELLIRRTENGLEVTTYERAIQRFQDRVAQLVGPGVSLAEELIEERRAEAAKEANE